MIKPIFHALKELLKFKKNTTISELSKVSGKKAFDVLRTINQNSDLLKIDHNNGTIFGFIDVSTQQKSNAFEQGKTYRVNPINYGRAAELQTRSHKPEVVGLKQAYLAGGLGDSYTMHVILDNEENRKTLEKLGVGDEGKLFVKSLESLWKEI
jgi:hypothetical protein